MNETSENNAPVKKDDAKELLRRSRTFVSTQTKYEDQKSTAGSFLFLGVLLIAALVLSQAGILPLPLNTREQPVMFFAMMFIAVIFLVIGFVSLNNAGRLKTRIHSEESSEETIIDWFLKEYDKDSIDAAHEDASSEREEILCLSRMEFIKHAICAHDETLTEEHADSLTETIYQKLYEE